MPTVHFIDNNIDIEVLKGSTVLEAAKAARVLIESPCNAMGTCGKCKVMLSSSSLKNVIQEDGMHKINAEEKEKGIVLSCQTRIYGDIDVKIIEKNKNKTLKIVSEGQSFDFEIKNYITKSFDGEKTLIFSNISKIGEEPGNTTKNNYGLAIDIGTTTLVVSLIDIKTGKELYSVSAINPQCYSAQDVLSRIQLATAPEGLEKMYRDITDKINDMISEIEENTGVNRKYIYEVIYSGNTTMIHLAANINPKPLGKFPYNPVIYGGNNISAKDNGIDISPFGEIYLPPVISAYVGPDITSGILASQLDKKPGTTLFIDIGTNGEMVIAKNGALFATSTAAGPAFEGMNISYGMRAAEGAVEYFEIDEDSQIIIKTIGNAEPVGICGSGLLDIIGELVRVGVIGSNGKFTDPEKGCFCNEIKTRLILQEGKLCFKVTENVFLTQKDIRQVQLAKGAVRSGIEALLESQKVAASEVDRVEIAGSFGYHLREKSLINLGLLPPEFCGRVKFIGNTSKSGAIAFLLNYNFRDEIKETVKKIGIIELSNKDNFEKLFVKCLSF
ncbi:MAG: Na(+)-translocating NADH-quinone reductase subunit [Clostridia bacterium]|nr:Na(+)-translocating NADH-quinone reductase subunit [Clostridia bacterium]